MTPEKFVVQLRATVIDENVAIHRKLFTNTSVEKASDPYWKRALALFHSLSSDQQEVFFEVIRQIAVDTTSHVLGVIDGVNSVEGVDAELMLTYGDEKLLLSGDLQDLFWAEEGNRSYDE
jgi:hypothetical protein